MRVLGVDPGIDTTGYACIEATPDLNLDEIDRGISLLKLGVISSSSQQALEERLKYVHSKFKKILAEIQPDVVVVEDIYSHSIHPRTGLKMGHVKGVIELAVSQAGIRLSNLSSTKVKKALLGRGNATKQQVAKMIEHTFKITGASSLHESDALATALAYTLANSKRSRI